MFLIDIVTIQLRERMSELVEKDRDSSSPVEDFVQVDKKPIEILTRKYFRLFLRNLASTADSE